MRIAVVGAGAMGEALLAGWIESGVPASEVGVVDASAERVTELEERHGVSGIDLAAAGAADTVVLAVKPYQMGEVLTALAEVLADGTLVVSIAAGVTLARLESALPGAPVIRVMPNTPALVGKGMAGVVPGASADREQVARVSALMDAVGSSIVTDEAHLDALTALSGSGPAYLFYIAEAMIEAGVHQGLTRAEATTLVNQTFVGSAAMLADSGRSATVLREMVTSPKGTTAAALRALDDHGVRAAFLDAVERCSVRSAEMAAE
ncbi:pyrroline-5-carboxylate reductase [Tessaracoccus sp. HDW20]|uniref:pyrroline-5-carboxylate reductase n=1 Tax=Tessaracoccus coleopterorum TaxID=2714950 RepID=UPI0018D358FA|nr:pyrroline-5-carboxylate reductase [Tessaracoccus coleopterorum]NHB85469.1 pyrroline-5-carboxylate reductase [Tessaracoccus coleopterorum]